MFELSQEQTHRGARADPTDIGEPEAAETGSHVPTRLEKAENLEIFLTKKFRS
jgi:hypothetical protein